MSSPISSSALTAVALAFALIAVASIASARQFYVDSISGSDSNPGTSRGDAWRTVAKVNAASLQPSDTVYFRRGCVWREMLEPRHGGVPGGPITLASYGAGSQPIISGSNLVAGWSLVRGAIYAASSARPGNVFVDGGPGWGLTNAASLSAMTPGSWFWDPASSRLFIWLADSSNPAAHSVEAAVRIAGFYANTSGNRFSNIVINGLCFERTSGYGIYFHSYAGVTGLTGLVIENNTVAQTGTGTADRGQYYNGIFLLQEPELPTAPQILNNTVSYSGGHGNGINCQGADNAIIEGNDVSHWNHNGIDVKTARNVMVRGNAVHDQPTTGAGLYAERSKDITWEQNRVYDTSNGIQVASGASAAIFNNSIYNSRTGIHIDGQATFATISHNAVGRTDVALESAGKDIVKGDYNLWGIAPRFRIGPARYTFVEWAAMSGHAHDLSGDPMWVDPAAGNFNLLFGSPCLRIDAGAQIMAQPRRVNLRH